MRTNTNSVHYRKLWVRTKNDVNVETNKLDFGMKNTKRLFKVRYDHSGSPLRRSYIGEEDAFVNIKKKKET